MSAEYAQTLRVLQPVGHSNSTRQNRRSYNLSHVPWIPNRLPAQKLARVSQTVSEWLGRKAARRRELESLVVTLQHATKVVRPGRRFVRRLIQVMSSVKGRDHFVRLGADVRSDLMWW